MAGIALVVSVTFLALLNRSTIVWYWHGGITEADARREAGHILTNVSGQNWQPCYEIVNYYCEGGRDASYWILVRVPPTDMERIRLATLAHAPTPGRASRWYAHERLLHGADVRDIEPGPSWWPTDKAHDVIRIGYKQEWLILSPARGLVYLRKYDT
jgi:hypothetical protein